MSDVDRDRHGRIMAEPGDGWTGLVVSAVMGLATFPVAAWVLGKGEVAEDTATIIGVLVVSGIWLLNCSLGVLHSWRRIVHDRETANHQPPAAPTPPGWAQNGPEAPHRAQGPAGPQQPGTTPRRNPWP